MFLSRNANFLDCSIRINAQYTLDNITSCLFGVETNSLQNENVTLVNHLKKFFTINFTNILLLVVRQYLRCQSNGVNLVFFAG